MNLPTLLSKAKELGEKATEGPWSVGYDDGSGRYSEEESSFCLASAKATVLHASISENENDAAFIAFARSALPLLVRIVERQEEALGKAENHDGCLRGCQCGCLDSVKWIAGSARTDCEKIAAEISAKPTTGREAVPGAHGWVILFGTHTGKTDPRFPVQIEVTYSGDSVKYVSLQEHESALAEAVRNSLAAALSAPGEEGERNGKE